MIDNGWMSSPALDDKNAMLYVCWGEVWIANLHPTNITMINSARILLPEALKVGDIIRLGIPPDWDGVSVLPTRPIYARVAEITRI